MSKKSAKDSHLGCNDRKLMNDFLIQIRQGDTSREENKSDQGIEAIASHLRDLSILQSVLTLGRR